MTAAIWVAVVALVALVLLWAYLTAQRLDRLRIRVDRSRDALQAAMDRRCAVIAATMPELAERARAAELVGMTPRDVATRCGVEDALRGDVDKHGAAGDLADADTRVMLALRFYNEAVSDTRAVRLRMPVRVLRLGGSAALPEYAHLSAARGVTKQ
ncbi:hypothetical protein M3G47_03835 [Corynebacterium sanguinis]|uniref:hypothetical protein n=1 Tax=Corynebacterium sanguinis TaxID=2594913 RepID=UPI00223B1626|nr:hypothetical protein [Corynebacterium sanguinis]MCT1411069.1 hypothetical protein [Corynebacterium sanguinis]MCT1426381.1 hypothetical protein [Corynebacterium sanguinis]MCT1444046.1 hypothetical protein [Corynebacterium sanguinis]MCT1492290.1 hypothetical protein [Corynebacterium sanguinis]MCT1596587.1 hypothetical protein [Corynebacterium sanguinis]